MSTETLVVFAVYFGPKTSPDTPIRVDQPLARARLPAVELLSHGGGAGSRRPCRYLSIGARATPARWALSRSIACEWSCETRDSVSRAPRPPPSW